jgi:hypothetical protein
MRAPSSSSCDLGFKLTQPFVAFLEWAQELNCGISLLARSEILKNIS